MGDYILTNWDKTKSPYHTIEIRLFDDKIQYVDWFDPGKNPNKETVLLADFKGNHVETMILRDFGELVYNEVCISIERQKLVQ